MSPEAKKVLSWSWTLGELLASSYHVVAIVAILIGLVAWALHQEGRLTEVDHRLTFVMQRIDDLDIHGTRALAARVEVLATQQLATDSRMVASGKDLSERMIAGDAQGNDRMSALSARLTGWETTLRKVDVLEARQNDVFKRLEKLETNHK